MIFMEEGQFIMNKKYRIVGAVQAGFIFVAFLFVFVDFFQFKDVNAIQYENEKLKEEIGNLDKEYLEIIDDNVWDFNTENEDELNFSYECKTIKALEKEEEEKRKRVEEIEEEIKPLEELKLDWNNKIAELEK